MILFSFVFAILRIETMGALNFQKYIPIKVYWMLPFVFEGENVVDYTIKYSEEVKLATVVEGNQKSPFPIATTPRCKRGHYLFPWIAPLYLWYLP